MSKGITIRDSFTIPVPSFSLPIAFTHSEQIFIHAECDYELTQIVALAGQDYSPNYNVSVQCSDTASGRNIFGGDGILLPMLSRFKFEPRTFLARGAIILTFKNNESFEVENINAMLIGHKSFRIY